MNVRGLCAAVGLSRAGYYRREKQEEQAGKRDLEMRDQVQRVALAMPAYGYRRITAALQQQGWRVNRKRVLRLMREDNLLCLRKRRWMRTTNSKHSLPVYENLAAGMEVQGPNQLWVADITYIRLRSEFVYLAVVLDVYSRRVIGWNLERHLRTELALGALQQALGQRRVTPGLVHHSDRGVQYASAAYTECLQAYQVRISMSRRGNPYDNAYAESFMKTLKQEEVERKEYRSLQEAQENIGQFVQEIYNGKRLHSALNYLSPLQFEQKQEREYMEEAGQGAQTPPLTPHPHPG
jgi:putative transposase